MTKMVDTSSKLTWFDEWMMYFEVVWGRTLHCWADVRACYRCYDSHKVFDVQLQKILDCQLSWPLYASYLEDESLRKEKWDKNY
jgi:hypothetical protein